MARSLVALALAVVLAGILVAPSNAQTETQIQQQIVQQILTTVLTQINYCVGNASTPSACPAMQPLFAAANVSAKLQAAVTSSDAPSGAPAPAPAGPYATCYSTLSSDSTILDGINPALVLPMCNNTNCTTAAAQVDTCIQGVLDNIIGASPASAPSPSGPGSSKSDNNPDVTGSLNEFCASPACVTEAKALAPPPSSPPPPPGSAAPLKMSILAMATLSIIVVGTAL